MVDVLISGYYGFKNAGDEAILGGIIRSIGDLEPAARFTVLSGSPAATAQQHGVTAIDRMDLRAIWRALGSTDLVITGGGSLLQDVTSWRTVPYYLGICLLAFLRRRPVMWYAQGIGPVQRVWSRWLVRWVGNGVAAITLRDADSATTLAEIGVRRPPVQVTADAAFAVAPGDPAAGAALLRAAGVPAGQPLVGVSLRPWPHMPNFDQVLAGALDRLAAELGGGVVFLPMQFPQDQRMAQSVQQQMRAPHWSLGGDLDYRQTQDVVASVDLLVGLRYHALVFAAMSGVPVVGLSYDPKNDSLLHQLGLMAAGSPSDLDSEVLLTAARRARAGGGRLRHNQRARAAEFAWQCRENARLALALAKPRRAGL